MHIDPALDPDLAYWLEMSEAVAFGVECMGAASRMPGNPASTHTARIGGAVAFATTALDFGFFNRACGLGTARPATEDDVDAVSRFFADLGLTQSVVHLAPGATPPDLPVWLESRGYWKGARWVKMWHDLASITEPATTLRIERVGPDLADTFTGVWHAAFGAPPVLSPLVGVVVGQPGWTHYIGYDGDEPVSIAAMFITDRIAWLGFGATLESHRGRGGQSAMFAARLRDARDAGSRWAITETGEETEANPVNPSYRNMVRAGFRLAYPRQNWVRLPKAD
jgi:hypothetical protein